MKLSFLLGVHHETTALPSVSLVEGQQDEKEISWTFHGMGDIMSATSARQRSQIALDIVSAEKNLVEGGTLCLWP